MKLSHLLKFAKKINSWFQLLAKAQAKPSQSKAAPAPAMSAAALQKLERIHVMKCAKDITGSDKPRKLAPALRDKVFTAD
jgi:hypothetical protein